MFHEKKVSYPMFPILVEGPAVEPVLLPEMKEYLRVDDDAQDDLIGGLIKAARLMVEAAARRILVSQRWKLMLHRWPRDGTVLLPLAPLLGVEKVQVYDPSGDPVELPPDSYEADAVSDPPRIVFDRMPPPGKAHNGIAIDLLVGFGAAPDAVPATLRLAVKILVARWYEHRGDVAGPQELPPEALALVAPFQRARL
ncbi:head-tail connector protein [Microvirga rosea]|uniref:head-tail connector protein n=1 Tax=Microvirga rosea TaxID=2715425 RepID=UPI001D0B1C4D|nr:head-tail connector protein [Microvirga rosea]MCB8820058.1 head-tail connector protein [Microvirga rosea]